jgi:hypothetical protein
VYANDGDELNDETEEELEWMCAQNGHIDMYDYVKSTAISKPQKSSTRHFVVREGAGATESRQRQNGAGCSVIR